MFYIKQMPTTKEEKQKQNKKMKLKDQQLKYMPKKEQVMQDMQVKKHLYLLEEVLRMVQKVNLIIKKGN